MLALLVPGVGMGGGLSADLPAGVGPLLALAAHLAAGPLTADLEATVVRSPLAVGATRADLED